MRIDYLSTSEVPSRAANSIHVMKMCQSFTRLGHQVRVFTRRSPDTQTDVYKYYGVDEGFEIIRVRRPKTPLLGPLIYTSGILSRIFQSAPADIYFGRFFYGLFILALLGRKTAYESHSPPSGYFRRLLESYFISLPNVTALIVISEALKRLYLEVIPKLDPSKIIVAHDGADPLSESHSAQLPLISGRVGNHLKVGYVGHLYPGRGVEIIFEMSRRTPDIDFHLIGGNPSDVAHWKAQASGALPNVFFHGFVPPPVSEAFRAWADILVAPYQKNVSVQGGGNTAAWMSPLKIFEYMAAGKAILCSDLPVLREVLRHGEDALLCAPNDIEDWINKLRQLQHDPQLRAHLSACAQKNFLAHYTWEARAQALVMRMCV